MNSALLREPNPSGDAVTDEASARPTNVFSVDVEDYFQVSGFEDRVCRKDWDKYECRVEANTDRMLGLLDRHETRGTFFILGWVAERYPALVKRIHQAGHEIASHGYWHQLVYGLTPEAFAKDIADSVEAIATACGVRATAYRAPSFSIVNKSLWALDVLAELGFTTDSSIFPIKGHDRYGIADAKKEIHWRETKHGPIREFPPTAERVAGLNIPVGGGYFRLFPLPITKRAIRNGGRALRPAMFYIHPWEIDPDQPRMRGVGAKTRFRHYVGLKRTERRLSAMLEQLSFSTMEDVISTVCADCEGEQSMISQSEPTVTSGESHG